MFTALSTPGVYYQSVDAGGPEVTPLRTDIAGFVGIAERGPLDVPVPVQSWRQFVSWFGGCTPVGFLAYAVRGFFENGGVRCWVVRVASKDPAAGAVAAWSVLRTPAGDGWRVRASSEGTWGNRLSFSVREMNRAQVVAATSDPRGRFSTVSSVSGFARTTHVRVSQPGAATAWMVVADVDPATGRLYWVSPESRAGLPYDRPLAGFDLSAPLVVQSVDYRLVVSEADRVVRWYDGLSLVPENASYGPTVLPGLSAPLDPLTGSATATPPEPVVVEELRADLTDLRGLVVDPAAQVRMSGGHEGLAQLVPQDFFGEEVLPDDTAIVVAQRLRGLRALERVSEIGLLAVPDAQVRVAPVNPLVPPVCEPDPCLDEPQPAPPLFPEEDVEVPPEFGLAELFQIQSQMVLQCEHLRDRFAVLDPPYDSAHDLTAGTRAVLDWRRRWESRFASLSYPWLSVLDPLGADGTTRLLPPSGHLAGVYAGTDLDLGVHHAPANRRLNYALSASLDLTDTHHGVLNDAGVNAVRSTGGRGLRALGARTVSSDPDWRFVNVRRLMSMIEKALGIAMQWAVFEPNGVLTRARATMSATVFLLGLHDAGMLAGATPEESFYVKCDLDNNPALTRDLGQLLVEVGVAPAVPFEFVVMRVGRVRDSIEVREGA